MNVAASAKWALVTGGAQRLGAAITRKFAGAGWNVVIHYNASAAKAEALAAEICSSGAMAVTVNADLAVPAQASGLPAAASARAGAPLAAIINNASVFDYDRLDDLDPEIFERQMRINALAPALIAKAYAQSLPPDLSGAVINLLDQKLWNLNPEFFSYTLSKAALHCATKSMAMSLAPRIRVNAVAPGLSFPSGGQSDEEFAAYVREYNLLKRPIAVDDIAAAALFLAETPSTTGTVIHVDNGQHLAPSQHDVRFNSREHRR